MVAKKIIILTGEIQTGKTTTLFNWVKTRNDSAGVLTPVKNGKRFFYSIPDAVFYEMETAETDSAILQVGRFTFSAAQFEKVNDSILKWLSESQWKYLIIDEIGPLELNQQKGLWTSLVKILQMNIDSTIILVVRKLFSEHVRMIFEEKGFDVVTCSTDEFLRLVA